MGINAFGPIPRISSPTIIRYKSERHRDTERRYRVINLLRRSRQPVGSKRLLSRRSAPISLTRGCRLLVGWRESGWRKRRQRHYRLFLLLIRRHHALQSQKFLFLESSI